MDPPVPLALNDGYVRDLEAQIETLRARNEQLQAAQQYIVQAHGPVSPLVLSPSSIPPSEDKQTHKEDELVDQLKLKDQKIQYLEQTLAQYKKKLTQTETLLYELQWDPAQDLAVCQLVGGGSDNSNGVGIGHENRVTQMLEQMRIMEKGLREKQLVIDEQSEKLKTYINTSTTPDLLLVADELTSTINGLTLIPRTTQSSK